MPNRLSPLRWHPMPLSERKVRAVLDGRATQLRTVARREDPFCARCWAQAVPHNDAAAVFGGPCYLRVPACEDDSHSGDRVRPDWDIGDRLWVCEPWAWSGDQSVPEPQRLRSGEVWFRADGRDHSGIRWRDASSMPRWASRLALEVLRVRVEHLQAIGELDARAEGVRLRDAIGTYPEALFSARSEFATEWNAEHADEHDALWAANPWVWATRFRRVAT